MYNEEKSHWTSKVRSIHSWTEWISRTGNRNFIWILRSSLQVKNFGKILWADAVTSRCLCTKHNRTKFYKKNNKSLFELWYGKVPNINSQCLKVFGTEIFANVAKQKIMKWEVKSKRGVFIGFDYNVKGCRIYFEKERKIGIYRDVIFCNTFWR